MSSRTAAIGVAMDLSSHSVLFIIRRLAVAEA